jgi:hypothetical protein
MRLRKRGSPAGDGFADGGVIDRVVDSVKGLFDKDAPKDEATKNAERQKRIEELTRDAAESSARALRRQGKVYPGANAPYADGGGIPGVNGAPLPKRERTEQEKNPPREPGGVRAANGGVLSAADRAALPGSTFGLPGSRKYPMPDRSHAANAKARATQQVRAGNLSPGAKAQIDAKANRILGKG